MVFGVPTFLLIGVKGANGALWLWGVVVEAMVSHSISEGLATVVNDGVGAMSVAR